MTLFVRKRSKGDDETWTTTSKTRENFKEPVEQRSPVDIIMFETGSDQDNQEEQQEMKPYTLSSIQRRQNRENV